VVSGISFHVYWQAALNALRFVSSSDPLSREPISSVRYLRISMIELTQCIGISISYGEYNTLRSSRKDMILFATFLSDSGGFQDTPKNGTLIPVILLPISLMFIFIELIFEDLKVSKKHRIHRSPSLLAPRCSGFILDFLLFGYKLYIWSIPVSILDCRLCKSGLTVNLCYAFLYQLLQLRFS